MKYFIQTLGCAMNYSDSERVAAILEKIGYEKTEIPEESDLYIFNTCSIRQKGEDRVYGMLHNLAQWKKRNPRLLVGITGCMSRITSTRNSEEKDNLLIKLDPLDFVFKIVDAHKLADILAEAEPKLTIPELEETSYKDYLRITPKYTSTLQAYVPIQVGCDKFCTYCIVPYARGREKSRPMQDIIDECTKLVENGCREIILGGQTVNSYGKSNLDKQNPEFAPLLSQGKNPFIVLLTELDKLQEKGLNRLRFTSPHPYDYGDDLINAHAELKTLTPHFHIPIQAGDNDMLKKMNRRYTVEQYTAMIEKIRAIIPHASITTDIIVGFCGETEEQFENTYKAYDKIHWDMAFHARYSPRPGTVSVKAFKDDISRQEKARRWHRLNKLLEKCSLEYHQSLQGRDLEVLVERYIEETGECEGRCRENKTVQFPGSPELVGQIVNVTGEKGMSWLIKGTLTTSLCHGLQKNISTTKTKEKESAKYSLK